MLTFHRDLGRQIVVMSDAFALLGFHLLDHHNDLRRYEIVAEIFYDEALRLREVGKVVKLAAGQPL